MNIIKSKTVSNGLWMYALQFFNLVVPLLTLPYITRILGASSYGIFSISLNIVTYLQVVVEYGFGMSATRKVATVLDDKNLNRTFTTVVLGRIVLFMGCILIGIVYISLNLSNLKLCGSFVILMICLLGYCVQMNWVFQGKQDMRYISIVNVFGRTISTILIFALVKSTDDLILYSLLYSISPFLSGFVGLFIAKKKYHLKFVKVRFCEVFTELKDGFYVFTTQLSSKVFGSIGITFLGIFATNYEVGVFSAIQKIPNILILLWTPISQILYPIVSKSFIDGFGNGYFYVQKIRKKMLVLFSLTAITVCVFSKFAVNLLFGVEYAPYHVWLFPLSLWLIVSIDNNLWGIQILLGSGHDKEYGEAFAVGVIATVVLNFLLIASFSANGAAFAPLLSEFVLNLILRKKVANIRKQYSGTKVRTG